MAAAFDVSGESSATGASPRSSGSMTVAAVADRVVIGYAQLSGNAAAVGTVTMTFAGNAMTQLAAVEWNGRYSVLFGLTGDASVVTGACEVSWTGAHVATTYCGAIVCNGAPGGYGTASNDSGTGTTASSVVTTASGDVALVFHGDDNGSTLTKTADDGTTAWLDTTFDTNTGASWDNATASTSTQGWTLGSSVGWYNHKINIKASAGGPFVVPDTATAGLTESLNTVTVTLSIQESG